MPYMGGLIGQGLAEYRVGQEAGAKGLPEGFARLLGHDVLAVVAGNQHYQVVGFDAAFSANMQFSLGGHLWPSLSYGAPIAYACHAQITAMQGTPQLFIWRLSWRFRRRLISEAKYIFRRK